MPGGGVVRLPKCQTKFKPWANEFAFDTYGNKAVLDLNGEAVFAELAILRTFQREGWEGVWVDTYRRRFRLAVESDAVLPAEKRELLERIKRVAGKRGGCFDVFLWRGEEILFVESKRTNRDRLRPNQLHWLDAALQQNLAVTSFLVVEWDLLAD